MFFLYFSNKSPRRTRQSPGIRTLHEVASRRKNKRQSRVKDFHVAMGWFNQRAAFKMITKGYP
jgi:hypothetical protein